MTFEEAVSHLTDDLEGDSGQPSVYGDTYGIDPQTWKLWAAPRNIHDSVPSRSDATDFYRSAYWDPLHCGDLPDGLDFALFEWAVNGEGPGRSGKAVKDLQLCLGVAPDGIMGPETLGAACGGNHQKILACFLSRQVQWYLEDARENPDTPLLGWENRVRKTCLITGCDPKSVGL